MTKTGDSLYKKSCAQCGFLYGLAFELATPESALFDPDLIRSESYPPPPGSQRGFGSHVITSQAYAVRDLRKDFETQQLTIDPPRVRNYTWSDTIAICCYMKEFDPISIRGGSEDSLPWGWQEVESTIRKDRKDCDAFFEYHAGHTAAQHVKLRLDEQRIQRQEAHEKMLAEWSIKQEERLTKWADSQENWRRALERRWMVVFGVLGLIYTALGWLVGFLIAGR